MGGLDLSFSMDSGNCTGNLSASIPHASLASLLHLIRSFCSWRTRFRTDTRNQRGCHTVGEQHTDDFRDHAHRCEVA